METQDSGNPLKRLMDFLPLVAAPLILAYIVGYLYCAGYYEYFGATWLAAEVPHAILLDNSVSPLFSILVIACIQVPLVFRFSDYCIFGYCLLRFLHLFSIAFLFGFYLWGQICPQSLLQWLGIYSIEVLLSIYAFVAVLEIMSAFKFCNYVAHANPAVVASIRVFDILIIAFGLYILSYLFGVIHARHDLEEIQFSVVSTSLESEGDSPVHYPLLFISNDTFYCINKKVLIARPISFKDSDRTIIIAKPGEIRATLRPDNAPKGIRLIRREDVVAIYHARYGVIIPPTDMEITVEMGKGDSTEGEKSLDESKSEEAHKPKESQ